MEVIRCGDFLFQLVRYRKVFPVSCYLVKEKDGLTLIDTGLPGTHQDILKAAETTGLPITNILLTHAHADHVGSLDALHKALPSADIAISSRESRLLAGDLSLDSAEAGSKIRGSFSKVISLPTRLLSAGDRVGSLEVIAAPGHTPGHVAYLDERDGSLIAGDAWHSVGGLTVVSTLRLVFPWPALATWNAGIALETAQQLTALAPARIALGHGPVVENPCDVMQRACETASNRQGRKTLHAL